MLEPWRVYTEVLHRNLRRFHATWLPGERVQVGDVGYLDGHRFVPRGNLANFGVPLPVPKSAGREPSIRFVSASGLTTSTNVAAEGAKLEIRFTDEAAVFFNASGCSHHTVDALALQQQLLELVRAGLWAADYVVVTHVVSVATLTVAFAGSKDGAVTLRSAAAPLDLEDVNLALEIDRQSNCALVLPAIKNCTPLLAVSQLRRRNLVGRKTLVERSGEYDPGAAIVEYRRAREEMLTANSDTPFELASLTEE